MTRGQRTYQFPPVLWDSLNPINWLHVYRVTEHQLWNPDRAEKMRPVTGCGLLESSAFVRADETRLAVSAAA